MRHEKGQRILIHAPPRYGKSVFVSQRFPAWLLGCDPLHRVVLSCYNETHAQRFSDVVQTLMRSPEHIEMFPGASGRIPKKCAVAAWSTLAQEGVIDAQPSFLAAGLQSGFTGKGVDTFIGDDPYANAQDAFSEAINKRIQTFWGATAGTRVGDDANVIWMFHRYHDMDIAGWLMLEGGWEYLRFPAIGDTNEDGSDPTGRKVGELLSPMRSRAFLEGQEKRDSKVYFGQFQGKPKPDAGLLFRASDFQIIDKRSMPLVTEWYRAWDLAVTEKKSGDFSAGARIAIAADGGIYISNVTRLQKEWPDVHDIIVLLAQTDEETYTGVEGSGMQKGFIQELQRHPVFRHKGVWALPAGKKEGSKKEKAATWANRARQGKLFLVKTGDQLQDDWIPGFISECLVFDGHGLSHDDQVDAVSLAMALLHQIQGGTNDGTTPIPNDTPEYFERLAAEQSSITDGDDDGWGEDPEFED